MLRAGAPRVRICPNCKSYQDWRRYAAIGQVNLALLVALISVFTAAVPAAVFLFTPSNANILIRPIENDVAAEILATNRGRHPGAIVGAYISINGKLDGKPRVSPVALRLSASEKQGAVMIEPGKSVALTYQKDGSGSDLSMSLISAPDSECSLQVYWSDFYGKSILESPSIPCESAVRILGLSGAVATAAPPQYLSTIRLPLQRLSTDAQFVTLARVMQPSLAYRSPQIQRFVATIDPKGLRLTGNAKKARQVINAWINEDDASQANQQQWLDAIAAVTGSTTTEVERFPKATSNLGDIQNIQKGRQANGALSSVIAEEDNAWLLTTVWPGG